MFYVFDVHKQRVGTIIELCGGERSLTFSRKLNRKYHDLCGTREQVYQYLTRILPGFSVDRINYEDEIDKAYGGRLS